jgi:hypothetical protein
MNADEVEQYVQAAAGEIGYDIAQSFTDNPKYVEPEYRDYLVKAKKNGCTDLGGALAEHIYNDAGVLQDLIGDYIYGQPNREEILDAIEKQAFTAMEIAVRNLRR